jgi:hypothetical protein
MYRSIIHAVLAVLLLGGVTHQTIATLRSSDLWSLDLP